ncbi:MAG TPA: hypothetical protein VGL56_15290 [Fimbriimonadaceae bacterium]
MKQEETEILDAETLAALDQGIKTAENGRRWTLEQDVEFARMPGEEWSQFTIVIKGWRPQTIK